MLVFAFSKERCIRLNPDIRLPHPAGRTKSGFTGMKHPFLIPAFRALIQMEPHFLSSALEHFLNIQRDTGTFDLLGMKFCKCVVVVAKDLF